MQRVVELGEFALFDDALLGHHHDKLAGDEFFHGEECGDRLVGLQVDQSGAVFAFACRGGVGDVVDLEPVDAAFVGEDQQVGVRRRDDQVLDHVFGARGHADAAFASASLAAVGVDSGAL